ncbi:MAG TPA: hypothetical protein PL151_19940 [Phycisphaerae bacterium]|nr:hypothetical protein [Phycisphaerae bacterium]HOJ76281.1 hypothetical protein [Phycisphaerae bacterium]HOM53665.1 hypothetical protein [Phycisphaerae bacterium]HON67549.1 hypothetical protein [Phycisphaerae bacterium]HOQ87678.1 hypothetical protein [Phycisphaerae bacterium]
MFERSSRAHWGLIGIAGLLLATSSGCSVMRALAVQTAPHTEEIDAEYATLAGKKVLVYVWAKPEALWDYPHLRLDLASHISAYLSQNVPDVEVIPAAQVEAHLKSLPNMNPDPVDLARHFHANHVIHVSIYKFSMRDPGLSQFYRGRISASVVVLDLTAKDETVRRVPLEDVVVVVPEEGPLGYHNVSIDQVRDMTYREFTQATGRKFHAWEKEAE